jgi:hypothetical protein
MTNFARLQNDQRQHSSAVKYRNLCGTALAENGELCGHNSYAAEYFGLSGKCAVNLIELCDYHAVNHGIVKKCAVDKN